MKSPTRSLLLFLLCATVTTHAGGGEAGRRPGAASHSDNDIIPGIVVVKFKRSYQLPKGSVTQTQGSVQKAFSERGVTSLGRAFPLVNPLTDADVAAGKIDLSQICFAAIPPDLHPRDVASQLAQLPYVEYAEPKYYSYLCDVPNDSDYPAMQQVYFDRMNVPAGWALQKGSPDVVIATVDGGTYWQHPDLLPNIWFNAAEDLNHDGVFERFPAPAGDLNGVDDDGHGFVDDVIGWNFAFASNDPRGFQPHNADHGTATASVFGAVTDNSRGMAGTSWNCHIMSVCAADPVNDDRISYGFEGIQYAAANGARVINCSWGRANGTGNYSQMEQDVVTAATQSGALIVAAAGNDRMNLDTVPFYPAAYEHVLSVGATADTSDGLAYFSNYGMNVSVFAPGMNIRVAANNGSYKTDQGTSFSAPLVAGLAGLLVAAHPGWTPDQIVEQIRMTADPIDAFNPGYAGSLGHGRVNFGRALSERHPGIQIVSSSLHTPDGRTFIFEGDTLVLSAVVKNIQGTSALDVAFAASSTDPALEVMQGSATIARLDSGQATSLPDFKFKVGSHPSGKNVIITLEWVSNMNERDARSFMTTVFASSGYWYTQTTVPSGYFYSVKAVNSMVAWAAGGQGAAYDPLALRTTDGGKTWTDVSSNLPKPGPAPGGQWLNRLCITATDADNAWIANWNGRIYATKDGGSSWAEQPYPGEQCWTMDGIWFFDTGFGYALGEIGKWGGVMGGKWAVLKTSDGGASWAHLRSEPVGQSEEYGRGNLFSSIDPDHIWFGTNDGVDSRVWRTTDAGGSWSSVTIDGIGSLSFRDKSTGLAWSDNGIGRSTDGGATWAPTGSPANAYGRICYAPGTRSAWVVNHRAAYRTDDDGSTWSHQPTSPFMGYIEQVSFADANSGWFVTNAGEILRYVSVINGISESPGRRFPESFALEQNYPNPFNPATTIRYQIADSRNVTLSVYDILGREVAVLVNEKKAPGSYEVGFDARGLSSGIYFYRLTAVPEGRQAGKFVETRKMALVK